MSRKISASGAFSTSAQVHHGIAHRGSPGSSIATQTYPKTAVTTRATGRTLQRKLESARPASSATI